MSHWQGELEDLRLQAHENWENSTWLDAGHLVAIEAAQECILELESQLAAERERNKVPITQELLDFLCSIGHHGVPIGEEGQPFEIGPVEIEYAQKLFTELSALQATAPEQEDKNEHNG